MPTIKVMEDGVDEVDDVNENEEDEKNEKKEKEMFADLVVKIDDKTVFVLCTVRSPKSSHNFFVPTALLNNPTTPSRIFRFMRRAPEPLSPTEEAFVFMKMVELYAFPQQKIVGQIHRRYLLPDTATDPPRSGKESCTHLAPPLYGI